MKTFLIICLVLSVLAILRTIILSYANMKKGGNLCDLFTQMHWLNYVPVINFVGLIIMYVYEIFHVKIK